MTQKEKEEREELKREWREAWDAFFSWCEKTSANSHTARCPRCKSTSITYGGNRPSIGRAIVGDALAGPAGAAIGGLTGKKGYAVCLKCGKRWKI